jgi:hypothetical protein
LRRVATGCIFVLAPGTALPFCFGFAAFGSPIGGAAQQGEAAMTRTFRPRRRRRYALVVLALASIALAANCSNDIAPPATEPDAAFQGNYDPASGELEFALTGATGADPFLRLVARDIRLDAAGLLHAQVAIRNAGNETIPGPAGVLVSLFIPDSVVPANVPCAVPPTDPPPVPGDSLPPEPRPSSCFFDHRGTYGDDGVLAGGETSEPVEWIFAGTEGQSFAFHARLVHEFVEPQGRIAGVVFHDRNENGRRDLGEEGIPGVRIGLVDADLVRIRLTDDRGQYAFAVREPGLYKVVKTIPDGARPTTPTELEVLILRRDDGSLSSFLHADFGCVKQAPPGDLVIMGTVFMDLDRDGERDRGESGIPGVGINASGLLCLSPIAAFTRTDADGNYQLPGSAIRCPLPWVVQRLPVEGLKGTTPERVILETPPPAGSTFQVDFGLAPEDSTHAVNVTIEGFVFVDLNQNGLRDSDDPGVAEAAVELQSPCDLLRVTHTDQRGYYRFDPDVVRICPVDAVWQSSPEFAVRTTPNPAPVRLPTVPGNHLLRLHFGVGREPK